MKAENGPALHKNPKPLSASVKADVQRYFGSYKFGSLVYLFLFDRTFRPVFSLRLCQSAIQLPGFIRPIVLAFCRIIHYLSQQLAGLDLPWRTEIGIGFRITHGWGLVINPYSVIGRNVTMFHGVTIAQKDDIHSGERSTAYPTIEDEVWIGPHAVVIGRVRIGRGSRIGAGAVVTKDVEPFSIVVGNPGTVIKRDVEPDVRHPALIE